MKLTSLFMFSVLFLSVVFLPHSVAQDYIRWELPEGAKLRLGKGKIPTNMLNQFPPYQFSPDSTRLAVMSSIGIWLYDVQTGEELALLPVDTNSVQWQLAFKPESNTLASGSEDGTVQFWDVRTGALKKNFIGHTSRITSMAFKPDGSMLASASTDGTIRLWDLATGQHQTILTGNRVDTVVLFSPDGRTLASGGREGVRLWDANTGELKVALENTRANIGIAFSSDGRTLASSCYKREEIQLWDTKTGELRTTLIELKAGSVAVFSLAGTTLATADKNYTVRLWHPHTGELKNTFSGDPENIKMTVISKDGVRKLVDSPAKRVESIAFSPDARILAVSSQGEIRLWNTHTGLHKATLTGKGFFYRLVFSPDGRTLAVLSSNSRNEADIYLWDINTTDIQNSKRRHIITGHNGEVKSIAFSPDGQTLASGHKYAARLWDAETGKLKVLCKGQPYQLQVQSVAFSPNRETLAILSLNTQSTGAVPEILLWNTVTGEYITTLKGHDKNWRNRRPVLNAGGIAFSPDGETLASGSLDTTVRLWSVKTAASNSFFHQLWGAAFGYQKAVLKGHRDHVKAVAFSPDGQTLASGGDDKTVRLWDLRTRKLKATLTYTTNGESALNSVVFSPDGRTLASGSWFGIIDLWDAVTTKHKGTLESKHLSQHTFVAFGPDSRTLASGTGDTIVLWNIKTQQPKATFTARKSWVHSIAFHPDGRTLASGNENGTILIWELDP